MWQETKHGLYKEFVFRDFRAARAFMDRVSAAAERLEQYPRWQNENNTVEIWLHEPGDAGRVSDRDRAMANTIDTLVNPTTDNGLDGGDVNLTTEITEIQLYADGGSRGNPGPSASGFVVLDMAGKIVYKHGDYLGVTTNNQAEYQALKSGLEYALHTCRARIVHVYMDSMLVVNQMKNIFKIKNRDLWPIHNACLDLSKKFEKITFDHVPRELNKEADGAVNDALDAELRDHGGAGSDRSGGNEPVAVRQQG